MIGPKVIVLGAGPAGLACARELARQTGLEWLLVDCHRAEVDERAVTTDHAGFLWDPGARSFVDSDRAEESDEFLSSILGTSQVDLLLALEDVEALSRCDVTSLPSVGPCGAESSYPLTGGSSLPWRMLRGSLPLDRVVRHGRVDEIDAASGTVRFADGEIEVYDAIISTLPLDILGPCVRGVDRSVGDVLGALEPDGAHYVGVALGSRPPDWLTGRHFVALPTDAGPFDLVSVLSSFSPNHIARPGRQWSLLVESFETRWRSFDIGSVVSETVDRLLEAEILPEAAPIKNLWHHRLRYGRLDAPDQRRHIETARSILRSARIFTVGALGHWDSRFESLEALLRDGRRVAQSALDSCAGAPVVESRSSSR